MIAVRLTKMRQTSTKNVKNLKTENYKSPYSLKTPTYNFSALKNLQIHRPSIKNTGVGTCFYLHY